MQQYKQMKAKTPGILLFFRLGDFYEMFFEDAKEASALLGLTLTARGGAPMCGVPAHAADTYIAKLLKAGRKVAICEQLSTPPAQGKNKIFARDIVRVITPGTVVEDAILEAKTSNYLAAVRASAGGWGFACLEASTGDFWITQNNDDPDMTELASLLGSVNPSEILADKESAAKLKTKIMLPQGLALSPVPLPEGDEAPQSWPAGALQDKPLALEAGLMCLNYVSAANKEFKEYFAPSYRVISDFMQIDGNAVATLELVQSQYGGRKNTLWGVLDRTHTPMGSRTLKEWILRPLLDAAQIAKRQDAVAALLAAEDARDKLALILKEICDIERIMSRVATSSVTPRDLAGLRASLQQAAKFGDWAAQYPAVLPALKEFFDNNSPKLKEIAKLLYEAVNENPPARAGDGGIIRRGYNAALDELADLRANSGAAVQNIAARERERTGISTLKVGFNSIFGYYIEVSKSFAGKVPYDYARRQTLTNAERFVTEELKELEKKIFSAEEKSLRLETALFEEIKKYLYDNLALLKSLSKIIAEADCYYSLAAAAADGGYTRPQILPALEAMHIEKGRHPVVEHNIPAGGFVPNNLFLGGQGPQIMIITGPNMGGKSVYLKQTALIAIMAQMGGFVPAKSASLPLTDKILTRIGAQDALSRGESTFMVEMRETANILAQATPATLVLLDEVGRGTSTFDGISIAWAIAEYLHKPQGAGPRVLFATHYFELTELEEKYEKIKNFHVEASEYKTPEGDIKLNFLFEIKQGPADKSYGIHVAEVAGLPRSCILRARKILKDLGERESTGIVRKEAQGPDLFSSPIVEEIKILELDKITPMQALQIIAEWKKRI
jgi:DNA mismatch repair protein MutS